jgi:spermidine synthase
VAVGLLLLVPVGTVKAAEEGRVVHEAETPYQYARVIEYPDGRRQLELNEGQAVHSVWRPNTVLTGNYWDGYLTLPFALRDEPPAKIAMLGVAGGTVARAYARYFPDTVIDAVEIDGELFDIGRRWFGLKDRPQLRVHAEDARPFLRKTDERYDFIFLDTYRQPYIPFYLATKEFFELARDRLAPGGAVIINVGHPEGSQRLEQVLTATMGAALPYVTRDPVRDTNTLLMGSLEPPSRARLEAAAERMPPELRAVALEDAARLEPPLRGGTVYTDDKAPVEWLVDKSIIDYAEGE